VSKSAPLSASQAVAQTAQQLGPPHHESPSCFQSGRRSVRSGRRTVSPHRLCPGGEFALETPHAAQARKQGIPRYPSDECVPGHPIEQPSDHGRKVVTSDAGSRHRHRGCCNSQNLSRQVCIEARFSTDPDSGVGDRECALHPFGMRGPARSMIVRR